MISNEFNTVIDEIKSRLLLSDIIKRDIKLTRKGREYTGICPFHVEKTGSFFVSDEKASFHCFGCGISGNVFTYVMRKDGITFYQALRKLADLANVELPDINEMKNNTSKYNRIYKLLNTVLQYYVSNINIAMEYCNSRNINNIKDFMLGFAPNNNDLYKLLIKNNYSNEEINKSGLFINNNYPRFRNRLMFPIFDNKNRVIAFGGRSINGEDP